MRNDRQKAEYLRLKGESYRAISKKLGIPVSTLSTWFKALVWSREITEKLSRDKDAKYISRRIRAMREANVKRWAELRKSNEQEAAEQFSEYKNRPLFLAGIAMYWMVGDRGPNPVVRFSTDEPDGIRLFYMFLKQYGAIPLDKLSAQIVIYPGLIESVQKNFWSRATGIPLVQFSKTVLVKNKIERKQKSYGVCVLVVHSRKLKDTLGIWIGLYKNQLISG